VWPSASVLRMDQPILVEDEDGGLENGLQTAEDWRLEMQEGIEENPEWNMPEVKFARVEEEPL
jgi:hypothetical protein